MEQGSSEVAEWKTRNRAYEENHSVRKREKQLCDANSREMSREW